MQCRWRASRLFRRLVTSNTRPAARHEISACSRAARGFLGHAIKIIKRHASDDDIESVRVLLRTTDVTLQEGDASRDAPLGIMASRADVFIAARHDKYFHAIDLST